MLDVLIRSFLFAPPLALVSLWVIDELDLFPASWPLLGLLWLGWVIVINGGWLIIEDGDWL